MSRQTWSQSSNLIAGSGGGFGMQANFKENPRGAGPYTVQFNLFAGNQSPAPDIQPNTFFSAEAEIIWSAGGNSVRRVVDVRSGMSVSGYAESVSVKVKDTSQYIGVTATPPQYVASVQVAPGSRPSQNQPPFLDGGIFVVANGAASARIPIPNDSGILSYYLIPGVATGPFDPTSIIVRQYDVNGVIMTSAPSNAGWVVIASRTIELEIQNNSGVAISAHLEWGVDG